MGLFSSIKNIFKKPSSTVSNVLTGSASSTGFNWSGLGSILNDAVGAGLSIYGNYNQNQQAIQLARENNAFQERMSNTAHQREMQDLAAAGLNPLLTATGGNGASTVTGSVPTTENIMRDVESVLGNRQARRFQRKELEMALLMNDVNVNKGLNENALLEAQKQHVNTQTLLATDQHNMFELNKKMLERQIQEVEERIKRARQDYIFYGDEYEHRRKSYPWEERGYRYHYNRQYATDQSVLDFAMNHPLVYGLSQSIFNGNIGGALPGYGVRLPLGR